MVSFAELDDFSRRFAERLFDRYPEWRQHAVLDPEGGVPPGSFHVTVPSPRTGNELWVRSYFKQITIDFGPHGWHEHFGEWSGSSESAIFDTALRFLDDLLNDRVVVITRRLFGRPMWTEAIRADRVRPPLFGRLEVYSWSGKLDTRLPPD
jgi:hypothetical protein